MKKDLRYRGDDSPHDDVNQVHVAEKNSFNLSIPLMEAKGPRDP